MNDRRVSHSSDGNFRLPKSEMAYSPDRMVQTNVEKNMTPAENAATVRKYRPLAAGQKHVEEFDAALDALLAQAEWTGKPVSWREETYKMRMEAAEADRDAAVRLLGQIKDDREVLYRQWEAAVRERDQAREALRRIATGNLHNIPGVNPDGSVSSSSMAECIARAALTGEGTDA